MTTRLISVLFIIMLVAIASSGADERPAITIVELPQPNSGTFTFEQAEARKSEIQSNAPTQKLESWKNPLAGFCIHIHKDDSITVYGHSLQGDGPNGEPFSGKMPVSKIKEIFPIVASSPVGVLITSDVPLKDSTIIHEVLKALFEPGIQLFYARNVKIENN